MERSITLACLAAVLAVGTPTRATNAAALTPLTYECLTRAAASVHVAPLALILILAVERGKVGECPTNRNGSRDCGPAHINSTHTPDLARLTGWPEAEVARTVRDDGYFNIQVAAWLLRQAIDSAGGDLQEGLARYHSRTPVFKQRYLAKIVKEFRHYAPQQASNGVALHSTDGHVRTCLCPDP